MPSVFLLKPGCIRRDEAGRILDARSSVTLIISGAHKIIVDSGSAGEEEIIKRALADLHISPGEVDSLVNTHSHPDHCGNNHLFFGAKHLAVRDGDVIAPAVWIMATPGHSMDSISVVVGADPPGNGGRDGKDNPRIGCGTVVIAGDAVPTRGNFDKMVPPALHVDRGLAEASLKKVVALADFIVPGHDFSFFVDKGADISSRG